MQIVTVSPKFQIVIPKEVRDKLELKPGQKLMIYALNGAIRVEQPRSITELRGIAEGIRWEEDDRDHSDRF
jgi:AbrB family looped-hinge helix DNA binding protein